MIRGKKVLAVIPARGGSKGVPRKNIKPLGSKPLVAWTIDEAKKSAYIDRLIVSTDDEEIAEVAMKYGCEVPYMRPAELAQDDTSGLAPVLHALKMISGYDYVVLLQPTSPLRTVGDIDGSIEKCIDLVANACVTVTLSDKPPYWMYQFHAEDRLKPVIELNQQIIRRQDAPDVYVLNGAVYVAQIDWFLQQQTFLSEETIGYVMPKNRSHDIDTHLDFLLVEEVLKQEKLREIQ